LNDPDDDVRAEAIAGLAQRHDERAVLPLVQELRLPEVGSLAIEAAGAMPRPEFIPHLEALHAAHPGDKMIEEALSRCREVLKGQRLGVNRSSEDGDIRAFQALERPETRVEATEALRGLVQPAEFGIRLGGSLGPRTRAAQPRCCRRTGVIHSSLCD
jgi:hypothetical protein